MKAPEVTQVNVPAIKLGNVARQFQPFEAPKYDVFESELISPLPQKKEKVPEAINFIHQVPEEQQSSEGELTGEECIEDQMTCFKCNGSKKNKKGGQCKKCGGSGIFAMKGLN